MTPEELESVRHWALKKLSAGDEPPWVWYRYMQLADALEHIVQGMNATESQSQPTKLSVVLPFGRDQK